ncbi:Tyrosyl-tRNA synthetase [Patulibacter medicamentivorans]|jgi:tyrosyl-tRNA synthetase|uniref:Tyrosine--tRNA ligase n=1 Tax=Patulibacter medicamentivorans TaxID=1097667 RepID=H0E3F9_9ACTN|nr:tyrosine--tRNA ligase [Patulibacter medicamentivorans]EHN11792.1 Tyrosyl-tRNA synthetase [Patulibacter medicamentivorans]
MSDPRADARFLARNAAAVNPDGGLEERLATAAREGRRLRVKLGIDPTAPDIHLGHVVVLQKLREFQDLGHQVVLIVGDYTARVGDPSGRSATRPVLTAEEIEHNARTYQEQAGRILRDDPELLEVRRNGEWLDMPMDAFLRLARIPKVAQLLERDDFAKRYAGQRPISLLEFVYPLLQGYDSVAIRADVEIGGTDQTFNLLFGRDVQRAEGVPEQAVMTMPLLVGIDGSQKMSKSLGNQIGIGEPADEIFGRTMRIPDELTDQWASLLAIDLGDVPAGDPRSRKRALARALCDRFAGAGQGEQAQEAFDRLFRDGGVPEEIAEHALPGDPVLHLPALLAEAFGVSRSEARRAIGQGGVRINGEVANATNLDVDAKDLQDAVLRLGKRRFVRLVTPS